ncbi:MAG: sulfotransferase, partial [Pseudomonadota bacterium]
NILARLGVSMGTDLNEAGDNLWYTFLFVRPSLRTAKPELFRHHVNLFTKASCGGVPLTEGEDKLLKLLVTMPVDHGPMAVPDWLQTKSDAIRRAASLGPKNLTHWGWKEPNTHIMLDRLAVAFPGMRYIHIVRNGLDMAFSRNQNQPRLWGNAIYGLPPGRVDPRHSLKHWCRANHRALQISKNMEGRFFLLNFDELCREPGPVLDQLVEFLGMSADAQKMKDLEALVRPPETIGRFKSRGAKFFDAEDIEFVAQMGFDTDFDTGLGQRA